MNPPFLMILSIHDFSIIIVLVLFGHRHKLSKPHRKLVRAITIPIRTHLHHAILSQRNLLLNSLCFSYCIVSNLMARGCRQLDFVVAVVRNEAVFLPTVERRRGNQQRVLGDRKLLLVACLVDYDHRGLIFHEDAGMVCGDLQNVRNWMK